MADILIEGASAPNMARGAIRGGPFWTSTTVGYVIYPNGSNDLVYRKTADGGDTWGAAQVIVAAGSCNAYNFDCWADWQTAGDAGTKIHIAYMSLDLNQIRYVYLDTNGDSVGGDDLIIACQGDGTFYGTPVMSSFMISITKTRGGNLAVVTKYRDSVESKLYSFHTSPDATTWTSKTTPYVGEQAADRCLLFAGNEADNQDIWGIFWDTSADEISLKTFDDSGNSWSEQSISGSMAEAAGYLQMDGAIRLSDGHLILAAWSQYDNPAADLMVWDINGAGSITAKTNVLLNSAESFLVSVFIDQSTDEIYVAYARGTSVGNLVTIYYKKSTDGGDDWAVLGELAMQANVEDDEKWLTCGAAKAAWGGKFQPTWWNDDLDDLFTNFDEGVLIAASGGGGIEDKSANMGSKMVAAGLI